MKQKGLFFIPLSFLSRLGDTVFLAGLPLYLFRSNGDSVAHAALVPVAIAVAVILSRSLILNLSQKDPLKLTGFGEILMGVIELILLGLFFIFHSNWLLVAGVVPLAIVYNIYAPAKFYRIQDAFFGSNNFKEVTYQSAASRAGMLVGIAASGWIVVNWGIVGVLLTDAASFFVFGLAMLLHLKNGSTQEPPVTTKQVVPAESDPSLKLTYQAAVFSLVVIALSNLISSWELSSSVSVVAKSLGWAIDTTSIYRSLIGLLGIMLGLFLGRLNIQAVWKSWIATLGTLTVGVAAVSCFSTVFGAMALFFFGGVLASLAIPVQREVYKSLTPLNLNGQSIMTHQWIFNAPLALGLLPIGSFVDLSSKTSMLPISLICLLVLGTVGGYLILNFLILRKVKT